MGKGLVAKKIRDLSRKFEKKRPSGYGLNVLERSSPAKKRRYGNAPPQEEALRINFACQFRLSLPNVQLSTLMSAFMILLPSLLADFLQKALIGYGELLMVRREKPFSCGQCENSERFIWKTRRGKPTKVLTTFAWVMLGQMQIQCSYCGH